MRQQEIPGALSRVYRQATANCRWGCHERQRSAAVTWLASECPCRTELKCSICAYDRWSADTPTMKWPKLRRSGAEVAWPVGTGHCAVLEGAGQDI